MEAKCIVFDLEAIFNFVTKPSSEVENKQEITEVYSPEEKNGVERLVTKQIRTVTDDKTDSTIAIKYDCIKSLMSLILDKQIETGTIAEAIAYNTFATHGFIKEV